jgi:hypothetical protein
MAESSDWATEARLVTINTTARQILIIGQYLLLKLTKLFDEWAEAVQCRVKIALPSIFNQGLISEI